MDEELDIALFGLAAAAAERLGVFLVMFCWLPSNVWVFLYPAIFLFGLSIMLYSLIPEIEKLFFVDPQKYSEDENTTDKAEDEKNEEFHSVEELMDKEKSEEIEKHEEEWDKETKILCGEKLEMLFEEFLKQKLETKNQVINEFEQERKRHEEERGEWKKRVPCMEGREKPTDC
ncbi:hypothetical protein Acr_00g0046620 [Actinidia rufa]|uniref:Transmembrane protein n=1 Tax=Actinidia rufa TaxID=165716 RepID=A0A7J0DL11_9ERIC|nr:hypothetical protein Acr_00g0046620 [Actinidia rufa]